jgi:hypothetical protein
MVGLWNRLTRVRRPKCGPGNLLILMPRCLQFSECPQPVAKDLANCKRCGKCQVKDLIELSEEYGTQCAIATGGRLALLRVKQDDVKAVVAVACEKELQEGMKGAFPKPVLGVINLRPHGPCKDTEVDLEQVRRALDWFLRGNKAPAAGQGAASRER